MGKLDIRDVAVWVAMGLLAGAIADAFVPGRGNLLAYMAAGLIGSFVGGFLAQQFNIRLKLGSVFLEQMIISVAGAMVVLVVARIIF